MDDRRTRQAKAQFIAGSLKGLIKLANEEQMDMLTYLLEMALMEAVDVEGRAGAGQ